MAFCGFAAAAESANADSHPSLGKRGPETNAASHRPAPEKQHRAGSPAQRDAAHLGTTRPNAARHDTGQRGLARPLAAAQPGTAQTDPGLPSFLRPTAHQQDAGRRSARHTGSAKADAVQPGIGRPVAAPVQADRSWPRPGQARSRATSHGEATEQRTGVRPQRTERSRGDQPAPRPLLRLTPDLSVDLRLWPLNVTVCADLTKGLLGALNLGVKADIVLGPGPGCAKPRAPKPPLPEPGKPKPPKPPKPAMPVLPQPEPSEEPAPEAEPAVPAPGTALAESEATAAAPSAAQQSRARANSASKSQPANRQPAAGRPISPKVIPAARTLVEHKPPLRRVDVVVTLIVVTAAIAGAVLPQLRR